MTFARNATVVGGAGSVAAMLRVGFRNDAAIPTLLLVLFTGWVISPFLAMLAADRVSSRWAAPPAATFLMVPLGSWLLLGLTLALTRPSPGSRRSAP